MRKYLALILGLLGFIGPQTALPAAEAPKRVFIIPIREDIEPPLVYLVRRGVKEAMASKADLLVLDMNTDGGRLDVTEEIVGILGNFKGQTLTYVNKRAFSAGSFISVATQKIYMSPTAVIGAAAPVMLAPGGGIQDIPSGDVHAKTLSAVKALVRSTAETNGYDWEVIEAMIDKDKELEVDGQVLNKKGELLTLTASQAAKEYGTPPKPLLSSGTFDSLDALLEHIGYGNAVRTSVQPTGAEKLGALINAISPILLIIGIIGLYIEVKSPGVVLPAVIAVIAFLLYFVGGYVAGLSGMEWVIVFVVGLALVISEFFVHPGTILPGLIGAALIFIALVMAMVDMYPGTPMMPTLPQVELPLKNLGIALGSSLVIALILARVLPRTPMYRTLVSQTASGDATILEQKQQQASRIGHQGVTISNLRPGGKAKFGDDIIDVITQGEMISKDQPVRIIAYTGTDAIVEPIKAA
jgi:membrane-bound serine protease (ClpP class)